MEDRCPECEGPWMPRVGPRRRWQNLLHKKCPNCDSRFEDAQLYFKCPTIKEDGKNCFFIKKTMVAQFLLDPKHKANIFLTSHERETIKDVIQKMIQ